MSLYKGCRMGSCPLCFQTLPCVQPAACLPLFQAMISHYLLCICFLALVSGHAVSSLPALLGGHPLDLFVGDDCCYCLSPSSVSFPLSSNSLFGFTAHQGAEVHRSGGGNCPVSSVAFLIVPPSPPRQRGCDPGWPTKVSNSPRAELDPQDGVNSPQI